MGLFDRLRAGAARLVGAVRELLSPAPAPAPLPPKPALQEQTPPPSAPASSSPPKDEGWSWRDFVPAPQLEPPPTLSPDQREAQLLDLAQDAARSWSEQRGDALPAWEQVGKLQAQAELSPGQWEALQRGHPLLLEPWDYLQRWEGLSPAEALLRLEALELDGDDPALVDRDAAVAAWERLASEQPLGLPETADADLPQAPPAAAPLQGGRLGESLDLGESVRATWEKWARSTLAAGGLPLTVEIRVAGDLVRPPWEVWTAGPEAVLDWLARILGLSRDSAEWSQLLADAADVDVAGFIEPNSPRSSGKGA